MRASFNYKVQIAMLRFGLGLKAKAKVRAASVPQNPWKWRCSGKVTHFPKNFEILLRKFSWPHRFTVCVQILQKLFAVKCVKRCVVLLTKRSQNAVFQRHFAPFSRGRQKFAGKRSTWSYVTSPCKISFQSVPICRIPEKVIFTITHSTV